MFDVSHMGKILIAGEGAAQSLGRAIPSRVPSENAARYTHLLRPNGTIVDDVVFLGFGEDRYLCVCNAARTAEVFGWFAQHVRPPRLHDLTHDIVCFAVQGPESQGTLEDVVTADLSGVRRFHGCLSRLHRRDTTLTPPRETKGWAPLQKLLQADVPSGPDELYLTRTGYTGEDGFEIYASAGLGVELWDTLLGAGVPPAGLGARDTLRLEKGYLLSGQDFDGERTPLEAGYERIIDWEDEFVGREALLHLKRRGSYARFMGVRMQGPGIPRRGSSVLLGDEHVGSLTSGTLSPSLGVGIGLGYLDPAASAPGLQVEVEVRGQPHAADVVRPPFL